MKVGERHEIEVRNHEHHHPPYVTIYFILVFLTFASILISQIVHRQKAPAYVFTISTVKALLIALFYMHLKYEGRWVLAFAIIPLIIFALVLFALMPDVVPYQKM
jgi:cytochrome c oxidase subunit 4